MERFWIKKKIIALFLTFAMVFTVLPYYGGLFFSVSAEKVYDNDTGLYYDEEAVYYGEDELLDGILYYTVEDGQACITYTNWQIAGDFIIPDTIGGYPVTSLASFAFDNCTKLSSITIPAGVVSIVDRWDMGGFLLGQYIEHIRIYVDPANPVYHSEGNCLIETASQKIIQGFNSSVIPTDSSVTVIGEGAFSGCTGLKSINMPDSVTVIEPGAFYNSALTHVTVPGSVAEMGFYAFGNCENLTGVTLEDGVTVIGANAFTDCPGLKSITIPASVTEIGQGILNDSCESFETVYYEGTEEQWNEIAIADGNKFLTAANRINLSEHTWKLSDTHPATCVFDGCEVYTCADCDATREIVLPALGHHFVDGFCTTCGIYETMAPYDLNGDGSLNTLDLLSMKISLLIPFVSDYRGIIVIYPEATYDLNGDGESDIKDLVCLKKRIAQYPIYN